MFKEILGLGDEEYSRVVAEGVAVEDYLDSQGESVLRWPTHPRYR